MEILLLLAVPIYEVCIVAPLWFLLHQALEQEMEERKVEYTFIVYWMHLSYYLGSGKHSHFPEGVGVENSESCCPEGTVATR